MDGKYTYLQISRQTSRDLRPFLRPSVFHVHPDPRLEGTRMCKTSPTEDFLIASNSSMKGRLSRVLTASQNRIPNTLAASPAFAPPPARTKQAMGTSGPLQPPKRRSFTGRWTARRCHHRLPSGLSLPRAAPMEAARLMLTDTV